MINLLKYLRYNFDKRNKEVNKTENLTKERQLEIEDLVNSLLKQNGYDENKDDYVDISDFVSKLNFNAGGATLEDNVDGLLVVRDRNFKRTDNLGDKVITVNRDRSFEMQRFIIAYEYAYFILKYKKMNYFSHRKLIKEKMKEDPDVLYFAESLLMPRSSFNRLLKHFKLKGITGNALIAQLASIYKVSINDIIDHIQDLKELEATNKM